MSDQDAPGAYSVLQSGPLWSCALPFLNFVAIYRSRVDKMAPKCEEFLKFSQLLQVKFQTGIELSRRWKSVSWNFFGPGETFTSFPENDLKMCTFFEAAKVDGVVYQRTNALKLPDLQNAVNNFCYQDEQGRECFAQVDNFMFDGDNKYVLATKIDLQEPTFKSEEYNVVVDHIRKAQVGGEKVQVQLPVAKIKKPLFRVGNYLCIPPTVHSSLYLSSNY
jgi:hypothetical protein